MTTQPARLVKLEADKENPNSYTLEFSVAGKVYSMKLEAEEDGLTVDPSEELEECLDFFLAEEEERELSDEEQAKYEVGEYADWFASAISETGLAHPIDLSEFEDADDDDEGDEG